MRATILVLLTAALAPLAATAQDRLVGLRAIGGGATLEAMRFGGDGVLQGAPGGQDSLRVRRVHQLSVPVTAAVPLGSAWTADVTSIYSTGTVTYDPANTALPRGRTATFSGVSDVRVRATARLAGDALVITAGGNLPTGQTRLDAEQLTAARVLAAPALGLGNPPIGAGGSATLGILSARPVGQWAVAGGVSYELHGSYAPIAALVAGAPTTDYRPGDVLHFSLGTDGFVGRQRLTVSVAADAFGTDRLRGTGASAPAGTLASVRLGPVLTTDVQLQLAAPRVREAALWVSNRWRSSFSRDGATVNGSSGDYLDGGLRVTLPVSGRTDLTIAPDVRWQSGLDFDDNLLTAQAFAGGVTVALAQRIGQLTLQPYARAQGGRLTVRQGASTSMTGGSIGVTLLSRF
jgi:hypothetical protein